MSKSKESRNTSNPIPETLTLYHTSAEENIPSILANGIVARGELACEREVDRILAEYGLTRRNTPESIWGEPLKRCKDTANKVYLSIDEDYAKGNCLAGLEAEYELKAKIQHARGESISIETVMGKVKCRSCEVQVPIKALTQRTPEGWQAVGHSVIRFYTREHPEWSEGQVKQEAFKHLFGEVTLDKVPPEWIKRCGKPFEGKILFPFQPVITIEEAEAKYSLAELQKKAREAGINPFGAGKRDLCRALIKVGALK